MGRDIIVRFEPLVEALERNWPGRAWNTFQHPDSDRIHCVSGDFDLVTIGSDEWTEVADDPNKEDALLRSKPMSNASDDLKRIDFMLGEP